MIWVDKTHVSDKMTSLYLYVGEVREQRALMTVSDINPKARLMLFYNDGDWHEGWTKVN